MALKPVLKSVDGLDDNIAALYKKSGDVFVLDFGDDDLSDHPTVTALSNSMRRAKDEREEARSKNSELQAQLDKLKGVDIDKYNEVMDRIRKIDEDKLIDAGQIDEVVEQRVTAARDDFNNQLKAKDTALEEMKASNDSLTKRLSDLTIFSEIERAATSKGVHPDALDDVRFRASSVWRLENEKPTAFDGEGKQIFGKNGDSLTIDEWVDQLRDGAKHLFKPSQGGGASNDESFNQGDIKVIPYTAAGDNLEAIANGEAVLDG